MTLPPALTDAFRAQARACRDLGSPFTARLCDLIADRLPADTPVGAHIAAWSGDPGPSGTSVPLRLAGTLNRLRLSGDPILTPAWPPHDVPDAALWAAIHTTLTTRAAEVIDGLASPPQTNEVRRSAALILAAHWLAARHPLPLILSEAGASAGLNLMFDRFALATPDGPRGATTPALTLTPDWRGTTPPPATPITVADRRGVDLSPLDPGDPAQRLRLMSYIWPDQPDRVALTTSAIAVATAPVDRADAVDWLPARLSAPHPGHLHLIFHTIAWQYLPPDAQARGNGIIAAAGRRATAQAPLARLGMEGDGQSPGAALTLTVWDGATQDGTTFPMGRIDYHGRWVDWRPPHP
jgi:hypothetical protein